MRLKIDNFILEEPKNRILDYIKNTSIRSQYEFIKHNMEVELYIDNLKERGRGWLCSSNDKTISIDSSLVILDSNNNFQGFTKEGYDIIQSQLVHELWHSASMHKDGSSGINDICFYLNEGITQMLSEDVNEFVLSKNTDGYLNFKKIAKILRLCTSNDCILDTYINHSNLLEINVNNIASDSKFYDKLVSELNNLYMLRKSVKPGTLTSSAAKTLYNDKVSLLYQYIITNLILPKYNSLPEKDRKSFMENILGSIIDDMELYNMFISYFNYSLNLSTENIKNEKKQILEKLNKTNNLIGIFSNNNKYIIYPDGKIFVNDGKDGKQEVKHPKICSLIYLNQYLNNKNQYAYTIKNGKIIFDSNDNIRQKRIKFEGAKYNLSKSGMFVANDFNEVDNMQEVPILYLRNDIDGKLSFEYLEKMFDKYELKMEQISNNHFNYKVINKATGKEVMDETIINIVKFANLWFYGNSNDYRDEYGNMLAFGDKSKELYNKLIDCMIESVNKTGNLNINQVLNDIRKSEDYKLELVLQSLLKMPENYEWIYNFVNQYCKNKKGFQMKKENSYFENMDKNYNEGLIEQDANFIEETYTHKTM